MKAHELLSRLEGVRKQGQGWQARCPAHEDKKPSLSIKEGEKGLVLKCHTLCTTKAICEALGIKERDLFYESLPTKNEWQRFPIKDTQSRVIAVRKRRGSGENKELLWELPNGKSGLGGIKIADLPLYGSEHLLTFDRSRWVELGEGEAKTYALQILGAQAVGTSTGAGSLPSRLVLESLRGVKVRLWPDNDDAGRAHMKRLAAILRELGIDCVVLDTRGLPHKGDAVQWIEAQLQTGRTKAELRELLQGDELPGLPREGRTADAPPNAPPVLTSGPQRARTLEELLAIQVPPRALLCGPWLKEGTITEVYGWRGAGKSWFCMHLAYCVSAGVDFMRWGIPEAKGVLYLDGEMGLDDVQSRLPQIIKSEQKRAGKSLPSKLRYLADSDTELFPNGLPKLSTPEGKALVEANLEGVDLVILDNLSTLYNSAIENDAESWVEVQDWMLSLRRRGLSVIFVHHAGKGGQQRGTSKREDICDNVIALKQPDDHQAEDGAAFTLKFEKSRGVKGPSVASFSARLTEDEGGDVVWALGDAKEERGAQIQALFEQGMPLRQIAKVVGLSHSNVSRYLAKNKPQGEVVRGAPPRKGGAHHPTTPTHQDSRTSAPPAHHFPDMSHSERVSVEEPRTTTRTTRAPVEEGGVVRPPQDSAPLAHHSRTTEPQTPLEGSYRLPEKATTNGEAGSLPPSYFNGVGTPRKRPLKE